MNATTLNHPVESFIDSIPSHDILVSAVESPPEPSRRISISTAPQLAVRGILQTGVSSIPPQLEIEGYEPSEISWMVCFNRPAMVSVRGKWQPFDAGTACLLKNPAAISVDFQEDGKWGYAFVCYAGPLAGIPPQRLESTVSRPWNAQPLVQAINGLHLEASEGKSASLLHHWIELIQGYVVGFASPDRSDGRVTRAWNIISTNLKRDWSVDDMATAAMMSAEHFRPLCLKDLGCSPMRHLTHLRVEKAAELLVSTDAKIESICEEVGYEYRSTFSNVFTKVFGVRPSAYRESAAVSGC